MALPIIEQISATIVSRLGQITLANSYEFDVASVDRVKRLADGWTPRHLSIVVEQSEDEKNDELSYPGNPPAEARDVLFRIHGFVRESDHASTDDDTAVNQMAAAIRQALAAVGSNWHTLSGNAIDAMLGTNEPFDNVDHKGVTVSLFVTYRISERDPYTSRA